ncbi:MAG: DUF4349 domain-containing protein [Acidobacteriota bacterium]
MKPRRLAALSIVAALAAPACSSRKSSGGSRAFTAAAQMTDQPMAGSAAAAAQETDTQLASAPTPIEDHRKVIRTGRVELLVASYDDARAKLDALVQKAGGYIDSTTVDRGRDAVSNAVIVVRLPQDRFGALIPALREIGQVLTESTNAADITDQYVDMSARLASAKVLEKRLLEIASAQNGTIDQVLSVERELARVRGEVEGYEGHLRQWNDQIAMSTLTLSIATKRPEIVVAPVEPPSLAHRTKSALMSSVDSLKEVGSWLFVNGIALLPWLVLLAPCVLILRRLARRLPFRLPRAVARPTMVGECGAQSSCSPDAGGSGSVP